MKNYIGISVAELKQKVFKTFEPIGDWINKLGPRVEHNATFFYYGPSGSGKSVEVMKLCEMLGTVRGKVFYNSWEEGISSPLQERVLEHKISSSQIFFYKEVPLDDMITLVKQRRFQVVVIDSSQYMGLSYPDFQKLRRELPSKVLVIVSQVNESGNPYGGNKTKHACDVKVNIVDGRAE